MVGSAAIGIICKAPHPGRTKTRLAATIGSQAAAAIAGCFLRDLSGSIEAVPARIGRKGYGVYAPAGTEAELRALLPPSFDLLLQADAAFGDVLLGAATRLLAAGHDCVLLVNGDSPTLPPSILADAIERLRDPGDRVVLGPASDGGYYLIGLKHAHARLFADIPWGTDAVARLTRERAAEIGVDALLLREWYDVDDAASFACLLEELGGCSGRFEAGGAAPATRAYVATLSPTAT